MSETQVTPASNRQPSSSNPASAAVPEPPSNSISGDELSTNSGPQILTGVGASVTNDPVQFASSNPSTQTAKAPDYFAEQNRIAAEKKKLSQKKGKIAAIVLGTIALVAIVGVTVALVVALNRPEGDTVSVPNVQPIITSDSTAMIKNLQAHAQEAYGAKHDLAAVMQLFSEQQAVTDPSYLNQLRLAQITFYVTNGLYQQSANLEREIESDKLPLEQRGIFYDAMYSTYLGLKDNEKAGEYFGLSYENQLEQQGYAEDGE